MRRLDHTPLDPEIAASLDAIDGTLAGEPVDPSHAELAELALLLAAERPQLDAAFATLLDEGVARRFSSARPAGQAASPVRRWWLWTPAAGLATAVVAAVAIVLATSGGGQVGHVTASPRTPLANAASGAATARPATSVPAVNADAGLPRRLSSEVGTTAKYSAAVGVNQGTVKPASGAPAFTGSFFGSNGTQSPVLSPPANGRKIIQSAQLALISAPSRIDAVAQEVFDVVGQQRGVVNSSTVTAAGGPGAYAQFQLSLPSSALPQAMAALSSVRYARVASRTDTTQDVNGQYRADVRRLADARALRTSLLRQLANATTAAQIQSLTAQLHDAETSISSDEATLRGLNNQVDFSRVTLTINAPTPVPVSSGSGGFTLGRASHDAGRVLTVAAGVALIAAAALVPVGLLGALGWWVAGAVRRRRREQALDVV
jgi:hypothetical protein